MGTVPLFDAVAKTAHQRTRRTSFLATSSTSRSTAAGRTPTAWLPPTSRTRAAPAKRRRRKKTKNAQVPQHRSLDARRRALPPELPLASGGAAQQARGRGARQQGAAAEPDHDRAHGPGAVFDRGLGQLG